MKFAANLSTLFTDLPLLQRPAAAARAGFDAVELWWPYETPVATERDVDALIRALTESGVSLIALSLDAGDLSAGDRGLLSLPAAADRFRANLEVVAGIAERSGCRVLNALYGNRVTGVSAAAQDETAVENLILAASTVRGMGAVVVVEALNHFDNPRYPLTTTRQALDVVDLLQATGSGDFGLLYDTYHMQRTEGNLIATIREHADRFAHVQIADSPDRHEPGTGEVAYERVLAALEAAGYEGYVGLEYVPLDAADHGFDWLQDLTQS